MPDRQFRAGLKRLEAYCREHDTGKPVREDIDLFVFRPSSRASCCDLGMTPGDTKAQTRRV